MSNQSIYPYMQQGGYIPSGFIPGMSPGMPQGGFIPIQGMSPWIAQGSTTPSMYNQGMSFVMQQPMMSGPSPQQPGPTGKYKKANANGLTKNARVSIDSSEFNPPPALHTPCLAQGAFVPGMYNQYMNPWMQQPMMGDFPPPMPFVQQMIPASTHHLPHIAPREQLKGQDNSEKQVWSGTCDGNEAVICYPKGNPQHFMRELNILRHLQCPPHKNIIRLLVPNANCMVLEAILPLGYDLSEVIMQHGKLQRPVPLNTVKHYVGQLSNAVEFVHARGIVHRDIKPDNILIADDHALKLIDFGSAVWMFDTIVPELTNSYSAPEVNAFPCCHPVDLWGIGVVIHALAYSTYPKEHIIKEMNESGKGGLAGHFQGVHEDLINAMVNLLAWEPQNRWVLDNVKLWASKREPVMGGTQTEGNMVLTPWPYHNVKTAYCAKLPEDWNSTTIGDLQLGKDGTVVLLVDPPRTWVKYFGLRTNEQTKDHKVIEGYRNPETGITRAECPENYRDPETLPGPKTLLNAGDCVYFGVTKEHTKRKINELIIECLNAHTRQKYRGSAQEALESENELQQPPDFFAYAKHGSQTNLEEFLPEFDVFNFPGHCSGAVIGAGIEGSNERNALNLRANFKINLAAIVHSNTNIVWWPGRDHIVCAGDRGLIMRVPQWDVSDSSMIFRCHALTQQAVEELISEDKFRDKLGLGDEAKWDKWCERRQS